ncbi:MAG TPA: serine/threonine-protein kinase [Burkholderiaceae bacterium]|nr:serine/threonine-protein kinase [Burkholderiaceae bacterium]
MASQNNAALPEGQQVGEYRIVKKISSGGFSIVYLATDEQGTSVAIKEYMPAALAQRKAGEYSPYIAPENLNTYRIGLKCFFEEGRALASIFHPNIVRVLNFFRANETVYMVMNYESGRSLQEHVIRNRSKEQKDVLSERFIRRVFTQVMNGLREVHSNRLLHLDVKPANIYLRMDGTPILLDFGAARQTLQRDISKTYPMYTPGFAAPELYKRDAELGPWTDVYSIGACIYACMAGMPPQEADQRQKEDKMPQALRSFRGLYSTQLISMVERCLRLNSLERPQTVYAVQKELVNNVPERPEFSFSERMGARLRHARERVGRFMREHNISWF